MARRIIFVIFQFVILVHNLCSCKFNEAYYWRPYEGKVPSDAFPGGKSKDGNPTYIGNTLHDDLVLGGTIYPNDNRLFHVYGTTAYRPTRRCQVLCTSTPDQLVWIKTDGDKLHLLMDKHLIIGGYLTYGWAYIGRVIKNSEMLIVHVVSPYNTPEKSHGCISMVPNIRDCTIKSFEVLTVKSDDSLGNVKPNITQKL